MAGTAWTNDPQEEMSGMQMEHGVVWRHVRLFKWHAQQSLSMRGKTNGGLIAFWMLNLLFSKPVNAEHVSYEGLRSDSM